MPEKFRRTAGQFRSPVGKYSGHHHPTFGARGQEHTPRTSNTPSRYLVECLRGRTGASCTRGPLSPFKYLLPPIIGLKKKKASDSTRNRNAEETHIFDFNII